MGEPDAMTEPRLLPAIPSAGLSAPPAAPPAGVSGMADSVTAFARRRGVTVDDETAVVTLLNALDPSPLVPHRMVLVAGSVLANAFRHDRLQGDRPLERDDDSDHSTLTADRFF
ncbi:hypothetical protein GAY29_26680 [Azospirillum brasilense]|nr:hypothetical protein [Azospirillum brasilense]